ncbi:MAG TPA: hypothetical protein VJ508_01455, partial [Saprospiraceae bacterium]|nr:hypothetical protein [Saprospiraceae bacterium]
MVPVFCLGIVHAQIPDNHVVATAGNTYADPSIQLDWTLGEVAIQSFEAGTSFVTLGIHQPDYNFVSAISPISESGYFL